MNSKSAIRRIIQDKRGANLVEYIMLVGLIAILCLAGFRTFGGAVSTKIADQKTQVDGIK